MTYMYFSYLLAVALFSRRINRQDTTVFCNITTFNSFYSKMFCLISVWHTYPKTVFFTLCA